MQVVDRALKPFEPGDCWDAETPTNLSRSVDDFRFWILGFGSCSGEWSNCSVSISSLFRCPRQRYHYTIAGQNSTVRWLIARDKLHNRCCLADIGSNLIAACRILP